jgi:hypothetical protein
MSLDLTKYREVNHERFAAGGSYTDTWLEAQGRSNTSSNAIKGGYVRWVPNSKSGTGYYSGVTYNSTFGYNQFNINTGFWLLRFSYYNNQNSYNGGTTSPGIRLVSAVEYGVDTTEMDNLASDIDLIHQNTYGDCIYVIVSGEGCVSSSSLNDAMRNYNKSWRFVVTKGTSSTVTQHSYAAIGTNINSIGYISEVLAGSGSNHLPAFSELVIEHDSTAIGHAGYGEELSSGIGAGSAGLDISGTTEKQVNWSNSGRYNVGTNEYIRATWEQRVGQGARAWGGSVYVELVEESQSTGSNIQTVSNTQGGSSSTPIAQTVDGWHKQELIMKRQATTSDTRLKIKLRASQGSGVGVGYNICDVKNLQVFKAGFNPDQQRDAAVHKYHLNGRNLEESPGPFRSGDPTQFYSFWNGDRNLIGQSTSYSSDFSNTVIGSTLPASYQYRNGSNANYLQGSYNWIQFFDREFVGSISGGGSHTDDAQKYGWIKEAHGATSNHSSSQYFGSSKTEVDHTKVYMSGVWVRVRQNDHTNTTLAPNRISMVGHIYNSAGSALSSYNNAGTLIADGENAQQSIYAANFAIDAQRQNWKLITGFYLPSWMTSAERTAWAENYWAKWAGHFEHGDAVTPDVCMSGITGYGITSLQAGYVCGMTTATTSVRPEVRVEQYSGTDLWAEFMYPFLIEIDPMNIDDNGDVWFWDFTENIP